MSVVQIARMDSTTPVTVFRLLERVSLDNFAELETITKDAHANGTRNLVFDLGAQESLSSIGVRAIVVMHKILAKDGGNPLKLAGVAGGIREVLNISGITTFIDIFDTVDDAVNSFQ